MHPDVARQTTGPGPPRSARWLVRVVLALLLVPGLIGFELWPLTGWRLFSLSRAETANRWVIEAVYEDGESRIVSFEELPMAYSTAEWPLRSFGDGTSDRAADLCDALLAAVVRVDDAVVGLRVARDRQALERGDEGWVVHHNLDVRGSCAVEPVS